MRSQLALDDFANTIDDIYMNNTSIIADGQYKSIVGKWEIIFQQPIPTSNGLISVKHAVPKF